MCRRVTLTSSVRYANFLVIKVTPSLTNIPQDCAWTSSRTLIRFVLFGVICSVVRYRFRCPFPYPSLIAPTPYRRVTHPFVKE